MPPSRLSWRLALGGLCLAVSLLAVLPAPSWSLVVLAILATEWGHYGALMSLVPVLAGRPKSRADRLGSALGLAACVLFLSPLGRGLVASRGLSADFSAVFHRARAGGGEPLSVWTAFAGAASPRVETQTRAYAERDGRPLELEIFRPAGPGPHAGVLVIHGGSWRGGRREELPALSRYLAARGYLVAAMDYRLAPQARFPAQIADVLDAVAYLKAHASEWGLDPGRLALIGRSAGGQIALAAAYEAKDPAIRGVAAFYAPVDLVWGWEHPSSPRVLDSRGVLEGYLGGTPASAPGAYREASPLTLAGAASPPTLLIQGGRDELVWSGHSARLAERLQALGRPHFVLSLPWATHGCDLNFSGPCGQLSSWAVERFLAAVN